MTFHNTIDLQGDDLHDANVKAGRQQDQVLAFFEANYGGCFTPLQVHRSLGLNCPETSIRRAITDLTKLGLLEKTPLKVNEHYGKINYTWRLTRGQQKFNL